VSYQEILVGRGYGLSEARASFEGVQMIRDAPWAPLTGEYHPICEQLEAVRP
jgi:UDP-N-acetyl-2-amino-2-deoxyglucuronate dehydrogenase